MPWRVVRWGGEVRTVARVLDGGRGELFEALTNPFPVPTPHDDDDEHRSSYTVSARYTIMAAQSAKDAILVKSEAFEGVSISGPDFNSPMELQDLLNSYAGIGFQATGLARAMELIEKMVRRLCRPPPLMLNASASSAPGGCQTSLSTPTRRRRSWILPCGQRPSVQSSSATPPTSCRRDFEKLFGSSCSTITSPASSRPQEG